jgi:hypothetical protein
MKVDQKVKDLTQDTLRYACRFCDAEPEEHLMCESCGYTWCDAQVQMDHYLCNKKSLPAKPPFKVWKFES